jgi:hypothetical protein
MERLQGKSFLRLRGRKLNLFSVAAGFCLVLLWLGVPPAGAVSFTASLDRDTITLGETAMLSLKFEGGSPEQLPSSMTVSNLQLVLVGGPAHFDININGNRTSYDTFSYVVTPTQAGQFIIPALTANVGGQTLTGQPLKLTVTKPGAPPPAGANTDSQIAFARLALPRKEVYSGETTTADLQLFYRQDTQLAREPQVTSAPADGFTVGKIAGDNQSIVQIGNAIYNVIPAKIALTANKTGTLHVGPVTVSLVLLVPSNDRQSDPLFGQIPDLFGMLRRNVQKPISVATDTLDVNSLPLPAENVPANFNGAVGHYTMTVTAGPTNVAVGDPITVRIQISGQGDLNSLTLPDQSAWHDFKVYPPTSKVEMSDRLGLEGTKTFEEIVAPQNTGVHELPPFSFSYFNPDTGNYRTLAEPSVALAVHSAGTTPMPTIAAAQTAGRENPPSPGDILPIKEELGALAQAGPPLVTRPAFLAFQSLPVLAWLAAFIWRKRTDNLANNPRLRRRIAVEKLIQSGLNDLRKFAAENNPDDFFAMLFRLLQEQLGERLDFPASSITEAVIEERLAPIGAPEPVLNGLRELFQLCNQARYAPVRGIGELNSVAAQFEKLIGELQEAKV